MSEQGSSSTEIQLNNSNKWETLIDHTARNGLITAIGVLLGFALTFLTNWSFQPGDWQPKAYPTLIGLFLGISIITAGLAFLIVPYQPTIRQYKIAVIFFLIGISIVFIGVFYSIASTLPFMQS